MKVSDSRIFKISRQYVVKQFEVVLEKPHGNEYHGKHILLLF